MKVYELLDTPDKWTQHVSARNALDRAVFADSPDACKWCLTGAAIVCYPDYSERDLVYAKLREAIKLHVGVFSYIPITLWNDSPVRTYEDVLALVKELDV